jgi:hypothetical protein
VALARAGGSLDPTEVVAMITSATTLVALLATLVVNLRSTRQARRTQVLDLVARYRDRQR